LDIDRALIAGTAVRDVAGRYQVGKSTVDRHRPHISQALARHAEAQEVARSGSLFDDIRRSEARFETLYDHARAILTTALEDGDQRAAIQAVRAAVGVLGEARGYLELRGELQGDLGRDRQVPSFSVQVICPQSPADRLPRVVFQRDDNVIDADAEFETIGLIQR
jgi:hypothetical protein